MRMPLGFCSICIYERRMASCIGRKPSCALSSTQRISSTSTSNLNSVFSSNPLYWTGTHNWFLFSTPRIVSSQKAFFINTFQQPRTQMFMNLNGTPSYFVSKIVQILLCYPHMLSQTLLCTMCLMWFKISPIDMSFEKIWICFPTLPVLSPFWEEIINVGPVTIWPFLSRSRS